MHGVLRLIQNEISKIFHQMSWRILTWLLLLLSIGVPILGYVISGDYREEENDFYSSAEEKAKAYEEGSLEKEYYLTVAEAYNYFMDSGFTEGSWQYEYIFPNYEHRMETVKCCQLFLEGIELIYIINSSFSIDDIEPYWNDEKEQWEYTYIGDLEEQLAAQTAEESTADMAFTDDNNGKPFTSEIAKKIIEAEEKELEEIKRHLKLSFGDFIWEQMEVFEPDYEEAKENYEELKSAYEKDKTAVQEYVTAKLIKEGYDIIFEAMGRANFSEFEEKLQSGYRSILLSSIHIVRDAGNYAQISKKEFDDSAYGVYFEGYDYDDYDDYIRAAEQRQEQYYRTVKKYAYCLEYNIPFETHSTRNILELCLQVNLTVIMLMGIFMSAVIVASEHTSGAVRLLMIRPRARWKILLSKLCCVLIITSGWIVATSVLSTVAGGILYGWENLAVPYVMVSDEAYEVAPLFFLIQKMTVSYLPAFSMMCLAFLMSTLIKRAVVSMAIPMIINIFGGAASTLFIGRACTKFPPLKFTPIPYFNLSSFWGEPLEQLNAYNSPLDHGLTLNMGVLMFVIYSLLLLAAAFIVFKKQQIKN